LFSSRLSLTSALASTLTSVPAPRRSWPMMRCSRAWW
jgi:hypothetical protein